jgi:hypothetical protein
MAPGASPRRAYLGATIAGLAGNMPAQSEQHSRASSSTGSHKYQLIPHFRELRSRISGEPIKGNTKPVAEYFTVL